MHIFLKIKKRKQSIDAHYILTSQRTTFLNGVFFLILLTYVYTKQVKFEIPFAEPTCSELDLFDTFF